MNNQLDFFKMINNPQDFIMNYVSQNNNPVLGNLIAMAQKGDYQGVENFARNLYKQQGKDFDKEYQALINLIQNIK